MSDDLVAFLRARYDEKEAAANLGRRIAEEREQACPDADLMEICERASRRERNYDQPWWAATVMALRQQVQLVPHDPDRALREVAADRTFLALVERYLAEDPGAAPWDSETQDFMDRAIRARCAVYSDHPDYRAEMWKL